MQLTDVYLAGLATYLPEPFSVAEAVTRGWCDRVLLDEVGWEATRIAGDVPPPEMAVRAARPALEQAGLPTSDYAMLLHTSVSHQGPDSWTPHHYVQRHTLGRDGLAIHLREGCQGMVSAIDVAASYLLASDGRRAALVTAADNWGHPLADRWRCQPNTVLSDGAAAMVLAKGRGFARVHSVATTSVPEMEELARGDAPLFPPGVTVGASLNLYPKMLRLAGGVSFHEMFELVQRGHADVVGQVLDEAGITPEKVTRVSMSFSVSEQYVKEIVEPLGFAGEQTTWLLDYGRTIGHIGTADPLVGLARLLETGALVPGDHVLLLASSWMMARTCAVIEIVDTPAV
jgi:3-oxoacyl-[acyl-carrier-protein] synthase III